METNPTQQRRQYVPQHVVALALDEGASIFVSDLTLPVTKTLVPGVHFEWQLPMRNRGILRGRRTFEETRSAKLIALEPLVVSLHQPWVDANGVPTFLGAGMVGHIRLARDTHHKLGILQDMPLEQNFSNDFSIWRPCRETNRPEEWVVGGPMYAAVYADEIVLPGFKWEGDGAKRDLPHCWIVNQADVPVLQMRHRQNASLVYAAREGREIKMLTVPNGMVRKKNVGGIIITYDESAIVYGLEKNGKPLASVPFKNGVTLVVRQPIAHSGLREVLGLPSLEDESEFAPREQPSLVSVGAALGGLEIPVTPGEPIVRSVSAHEPMVAAQAAPAKAVPLAPRRAGPPKLSDVNASPEAAPASTPVEVEVSHTEDAPAEPVKSAEEIFAEAEWPEWGSDALKELTEKVGDQNAAGDYLTEEGHLIAKSGTPLIDVIASFVQAHDRLAFEGEDYEQFQLVKEIIAAYNEVYA